MRTAHRPDLFAGDPCLLFMGDGGSAAPRHDAHRRITRIAAPNRESVHDRVALEEIDLYAELIIAAQRSEQPLSWADIDAVLGVRPAAAVGV